MILIKKYEDTSVQIYYMINKRQVGMWFSIWSSGEWRTRQRNSANAEAGNSRILVGADELDHPWGISVANHTMVTPMRVHSLWVKTWDHNIYIPDGSTVPFIGKIKSTNTDQVQSYAYIFVIQWRNWMKIRSITPVHSIYGI